MLKKHFLMLGLALTLSLSSTVIALADESGIATTTMENCGAYLFEWRPVDCGEGHYFAILVGGNTIQEHDVILSRGYDYPYTFDVTTPRPWGEAPSLVNIDGVWGIPENWGTLPEGSQPTLRITIVTNNKILSTKERYIDVVSLPSSVDSSELPPEVRKYMIRVDGDDAGAYQGTITSGWEENEEDGTWRYRKPDDAYISNSWLKLDDKQYYMNEDGIMLSDTITPDGHYVNAKGEKTTYIPGWYQDGASKRYILKNGYYAANRWIQDTDGKWYYFNMAANMLTDTTTPDGCYVDANGVWDGVASTKTATGENLGPGAGSEETSAESTESAAEDTSEGASESESASEDSTESTSEDSSDAVPETTQEASES